jgi:hypothetical protein
MYFVGVPLLIVPFAIYNIFAFLIPGVDWATPFTSVTLRSGAEWKIAPGDILIAFSILILLVELIKLTRLGWRSWVDHLLAFALFAGMTAEFILVRAVASPTFFLLVVIGFVDFFGGVVSALAARARRRELVMERGPSYPVVPTRPEPKFQPAPETKPDPKPDPAPPAQPSEQTPA